jgi:histidine triad (HIT) family protein
MPGGLLWNDGLAAAFHVPPLSDQGDPYLGHLLVVTRRHAAGLADLSGDEGASVGRGAALLSRALVAIGGATWVHAGVVGTHVPHFHLHLVPRYADTPEDVPWHEVDEWEGARHGNAEEIAELAARLGTDQLLKESQNAP